MADERARAFATTETELAAESATGADLDTEFGHDDSSDWTAWSNLWQAPAIVLSVLLIGFGLYVAGHRAPENDFNGALDQIDRLIAAGDFPTARTQLKEVVEPNLFEATTSEQARFHATVADWLAASQEVRGVSVDANNRVIAEQYARAVELGSVLNAIRIERWANALVDLGEIDEARNRFAELDALGFTETAGEDARVRRNRLLRRLVEFSLTQEDLAYESMLEVLETFRSDSLLSAADKAWVAARQARLRLEAGYPDEAVAHLLVSMRRLEVGEDPIAPADWAELYTLLGRGYYDQGLNDNASYYLDEAMSRLVGAEPVRGEILLLQGRILVAAGDLEQAFDRFDLVVRDYRSTPALLPALLARAETRSILGDHAGSRADYAAVIGLLPEAGPRRDVTPRLVAASLADRHDAALTMGDLPLALEYVGLAERLFDPGAVPRDVLERSASTSRQIADNLMTEAVAALGNVPPRPELIDPELRARAAAMYERTGAYFLRHARLLAAVPGADDEWAASLWSCADCYDLAGRRDLAIEYMHEYIAGRAVDDPRRAEVTYRLAQAYEAEMDFESAARFYEQVVQEHPRSTWGTRSHVPLARCHVRTGRDGEAEKRLIDVVDGRQGSEVPITPDAPDYRDALIALGELYYDASRTTLAIERLTAALERYPDDERVNETRFRLADSFTDRARQIAGEIEAQPRMSPGERRAKEAAVRAHRETALDLFTDVIDGYAMMDPRRLDGLQRDCLRYAVFSRADCAFDLERYELAEALYDEAARRYSDHHGSMYALVQIVNCFERMGDTRAADIAHRNALLRLRQLPPGAFDDPESLMDRGAWGRWLRNRPVGVAAAPPSSPPAN